MRAKKERYKINSQKPYLYSGNRFFLGGVLLEEHFLHQGAGFDDLRVRYAVIDVDPGPPRRQNALVPHHGEVLGHISFGRPESSHEFGHGFFFGFEGIEDLNALRVGEGLADLSLYFENRFVGQDGFHAFLYT